MQQLRLSVFLPPFLFLLASAIYSLIDTEGFLFFAKTANDWILTHFGWLFSISTLTFLGIVIMVYFSPLAKVKIGGKDAAPILSKWRWFSITLCTTIAIGILFWGGAEPLYHFHQPPTGLGISPESPAAARFGLATMFLHWTFTPYGIYTMSGLTFALVYYNLKQPFSLGSMLYPLIGDRAHGNLGKFIDAISLYALVAGMASSLGAGILTIASGLETVIGIPKTAFTLGLVAAAIVITFIVSAASGLQKGIRILSDINIRFFFGFGIFVFIFGPTLFILGFGVDALGEYFQQFFRRSLYTGVADGDGWANSWTIFYWANWLAWTPVTALFLGRLAVGRTVKEFIHFNLIYTSLFSIFWMMIFSGTSLYFDSTEANFPMFNTLQTGGPEAIIYALFERLPFSALMSFLFLLIAFLSYVTAADSNTSAMASISSTGISPETPEPPLFIKVAWGASVGVIAWVMVAFAGIDGIKMASNLGGFPALFLIIAVAGSLIKLMRNADKL
ncbi:MAG: BCCT family transporter [Saprospiraceae bacterium]